MARETGQFFGTILRKDHEAPTVQKLWELKTCSISHDNQILSDQDRIDRFHTACQTTLGSAGVKYGKILPIVFYHSANPFSFP